ncbi:helix-turn-helix domain-containing protein [Clostridium estertheticum]|uniref:helix-turn-helix domain-containing protein n=1 Tax=Clostridium estertheticum TaxID=238834 RepID=UPI001CF20145|nr:helix-turn-helix transcriptional regulator [Clostridium estertheticum]MCB2309023.1 helix-turn-helix domain-containing protein [Clostridium estertheticum]MCB2346843.1 helix-turn-helix domain-containing protein [Clostridium estertheticum]MCB2351845.1 helix-turn-helix domain-containing protein [Clostridium estertheticum]WAG48448.1 helix-turn-helix domain-containing protein [Clostridium estertheticum]
MNKFSKEKLEASMLYADLNVKELSTISNVGASTLYEILNGTKNNPKSETLSKLADALNISVNDFYHDDNIIIKETAAQYQSQTKENKEILSNISKLNTKDKKLFKALLAKFNEK